jgi:hypothetical protein
VTCPQEIFAHRHHVIFFHAHDGKKLRQHHKASTLRHRIFNQAARLTQVTLDIRARSHLQCGNLESIRLRGYASLRGTCICHDVIS